MDKTAWTRNTLIGLTAAAVGAGLVAFTGSGSFDRWLQLAERLGIPFACLVALALAVWVVLRGLLANIAVPLARKHIEFLNAVTTSMKRGVRHSRRSADQMKHVADRLEHLIQVVETNGVTVNTGTVTIATAKAKPDEPTANPGSR